jgi:arylsulfatase A-like enzyme
MRAVMVMFDSLNRRMLPPYGAEGVHAPNFERLAARSVTFDNAYAGSMPCMPARRELHTGRYNFLHRSWSPLEPFDDSMPAMLGEAGVYTHLITDHQHYWEDGGATYHNRYNTYEFFRGQEGDAWKAHVDPGDAPESLNGDNFLVRQDWINRQYLTDEADHPQTRTFDAGLEFLETNRDADSWFLQIECFDPHEPFFTYDDYRAHYESEYTGAHFDWPAYRRVVESPDEVEHARNEYLALMSMCDNSLGRVLDVFDEQNLWEDTLLIVCTDHGFLLGEHGWWGKSVQPWFDETIHTPLFVWDPRSKRAGERRDALVQTVDIAPTLLDFFGLDATPEMTGSSLASVIDDGTPVREAGLFGLFGSHVNVTDGRYVYMRASVDETNQPLFDYTLMPMHMRSMFSVEELRTARLVPPFAFTKEVPLLEVPGWTMGNPFLFGTLLFDLHNDPDQRTPLRDDDQELRLIGLMLDLMRENDAPVSQYERLGLPAEGAADASHLLVARQWEQMMAARTTAVRVEDFGSETVIGSRDVDTLLDDPGTRDIVLGVLPMLANPLLRGMLGAHTIVHAAAARADIGREDLDALELNLTSALAATRTG